MLWPDALVGNVLTVSADGASESHSGVQEKEFRPAKCLYSVGEGSSEYRRLTEGLGR